MKLLRKVHLMVAVAGLMAAFGGGLTATPAFAGDTLCTGVVTGAHDNIIVPSGATCELTNAKVKGSVKVLSEGSLDVFEPTTIGGNVDGEPGHNYVRLWGGAVVVKGNVQLKGSGVSSGYLIGTHIGGNFQYEGNAGFLVADGGTVKGDLKMEKNTGGGAIFDNSIGGNLQCKENDPPPFGGGNTVGGNKEGQCAGF